VRRRRVVRRALTEPTKERPMLLIPNFVTLALYLIGCNGGW
jgi:hypothetical protein